MKCVRVITTDVVAVQDLKDILITGTEINPSLPSLMIDDCFIIFVVETTEALISLKLHYSVL